MEVLKELVRNVVIIILLTTFLDMLLPSGSLRPFVKVIMGLFVLVSLLNPLLSFFLNENEFEVFAWQQENSTAGFDTVLADSSRLNNVNQEIFLRNYASQIAVQMESLLKLVKGAEDINVQVVLEGGQQAGSLEGIKKVTVFVGLIKTASIPENKGQVVEPVKIKIESDQPSDREIAVENKGADAKNSEQMIIESEISDILVKYFALKPAQISVVFTEVQ